MKINITDKTIARVLGTILRWWSTPILGIKVQDGNVSVHFMPQIPASASIDERIAKLDTARENLIETLGAIDEMSSEAQRHKEEINVLSSQLEHASKEKEMLEQQVEATRLISEIDADSFRKIAGLPTRRQIAWERFIGFVLGVVASITASGLWWIGTKYLG